MLGQLWIDFREDEILSDFIEYNDLGMPLSYMISEGLVTATELAEQYVNETFALFLEIMNLTEPEVEDCDSLGSLLELSEMKKNLEG